MNGDDNHNSKQKVNSVNHPSKNIAPEQVRDEIVECFLEAHSDVLEDLENYQNMSKEDMEKIKRTDVETLIKNFFDEVGGDFNHPDKKSLIMVINRLADFSKKFRSAEIVEKNYKKLLDLINKL